MADTLTTYLHATLLAGPRHQRPPPPVGDRTASTLHSIGDHLPTESCPSLASVRWRPDAATLRGGAPHARHTEGATAVFGAAPATAVSGRAGHVTHHQHVRHQGINSPWLQGAAPLACPALPCPALSVPSLPPPPPLPNHFTPPHTHYPPRTTMLCQHWPGSGSPCPSRVIVPRQRIVSSGSSGGYF